MNTNNKYEEELKGGHAPDQTMFSLSWDIEELNLLNHDGRTLHDVLPPFKLADSQHDIKPSINAYIY